jgi:hypothetical protein
VIAMTRRTNRRLVGATLELDRGQCVEMHAKIHRALGELGRPAAKWKWETNGARPRLPRQFCVTLRLLFFQIYPTFQRFDCKGQLVLTRRRERAFARTLFDTV